MKWRREAVGVLCDKKLLLKVKEKFYKTFVRPATMYSSEYWAKIRKKK